MAATDDDSSRRALKRWERRVPGPPVILAHIAGKVRSCGSRLKTLTLLAGLLAGFALDAQSVRLAIVLEDTSFSSEADFLTVELSRKDNLQLVERAELRKVLKEQALASGHGTDFVKLGEILGADGVLLLDSVVRGGHKLLSVRLAAVKPGVVLELADFEAPIADKADWSRIVAQRFAPLFPKLGVLPKDAVPVSFLNLRSAVQSAAGESLERELNMVLIRRLLHQREIFVLERQKLQALAREKDFKGLGDAPFWAGSFLLEGTIDKHGYDAQRLTLSARLTPPGQRRPIDLEVSGRRSAPLPLLEELATKILSQLAQPGQTREWNIAEEANHYFDEAKWALRWRMFPEAQAAADSAWALGRTDLDCALARVNAHLRVVTPNRLDYVAVPAENPFLSSYAPAELDAKGVDSTLRMLEAYTEFNQTLPADSLSVTSAW